jgi:hypothetical protein
MTSRKNSSRKLSFQTLEDRQLMAANVTAAVSNHMLNITGDSNADSIQIVQVGKNKFEVIGENGTKVNKHNNQTFSGVTGDVNVTFFNDGQLDVGDANKPNKTVSITGNLNVQFNGGDSSINILGLQSALIGGSLSVTTAAEAENHIQIISGSVGKDVNINVNASENSVEMFAETIGRDFNFKNSLNDVADSDAQRDDLEIVDGSVGRNATILTGTGDDFVQMDGISIGGELTIITGDGNDEVVLGGFDPSQQDLIKNLEPPVGMNADQVYADLGNGNDVLQLGESHAGGITTPNEAIFDADGGDDVYLNETAAGGIFGDLSGFESTMPLKPLLGKIITEYKF